MPCASLALSAAAAILFVLPSATAVLEFDREAIAAGQWWRVITGHWTHYSIEHLGWDLVAFAVLGTACERESRLRFLLSIVASAAAISLAVFLWMPNLLVYRGLSGIDAALFALLVLDLEVEGVGSRRSGQTLMAAACLAGFVFKVLFEIKTGANVFVTGQPGIVGVPIAHVAGAATGLLLGIALPLQRWRSANAEGLLRTA